MPSALSMVLLVALLSIAGRARADGVPLEPTCRGRMVVGPGGLECVRPDLLGDYPDASAEGFFRSPSSATPPPVAHEARVRRIDTMTTGLVIGALTLLGAGVVTWRLRRPARDQNE